MTLLQAAVLGLVQGLTEFLPVSSSGHLIFIPTLFGWPDQGVAFDVMVHLGTLLAVVIYFRKNIWEMLTSKRRLGLFVALSIIPAGIGGYLLETNTRSAQVVGISLIVWGIVLGIADWYAKRRSAQTSLEQMKPAQVVAIACAQVIALIPGTSRSGITMSAGLFSGLTKKNAAEFSFLMSIPIISLAGGVKLLELLGQGSSGIASVGIAPLLLGCAVAAVSGGLAIWGLMQIIQRWSFQPFMWYRIAIGLLILIWL